MFPSRYPRAAQISDANRSEYRPGSGIKGLWRRVRQARQWKRQIARLGSADEAEYGHALEWLLMQGEEALPYLHRALRGSPAIAFGAAGLLHHRGYSQGVRHVLLRAYQDEWFTRYPGRDIEEYGTQVGLRIGKAPILQAVGAAFEQATQFTDEQACLQTLIVALSGLRALDIMAPRSATFARGELEPAPAIALAIYTRALNLGPATLPQVQKIDFSIPLLANMTDWIRAEAIRRLLREQKGDICLAILSEALRSGERQVARSAIDGLQQLGNSRAVPALEAIAFTSGHPLAGRARHAIERLAGPQAEVSRWYAPRGKKSPPKNFCAPRAPLRAYRRKRIVTRCRISCPTTYRTCFTANLGKLMQHLFLNPPQFQGDTAHYRARNICIWRG